MIKMIEWKVKRKGLRLLGQAVSWVPASEKTVRWEIWQAVVFFLEALFILKVRACLVMGRPGSPLQPLLSGLNTSVHRLSKKRNLSAVG